jgi:iron complex outermembrane receptor protein
MRQRVRPMLCSLLTLLSGGAIGVAAQEPEMKQVAFVLRFTPERVADVDALPVVLRQSMTLELPKVTIERALHLIAARAGLDLAYSRAVVPVGRVVSVQVRAGTVAEALRQVLRDVPVELWISAEGKAALVPLDSEHAGRVVANGSVAGRVTDRKTGGALAGATVALEGTSHSATTASDGRYRIADVVPGTYTVRARYIGYAPGTASVNVSADQEATADFGLERSATKLEDVVTVQKREERLINTPQSVSVLSSAELGKLGATQFRDFANTVPGLTFGTSGAGFNQISLRGVTAGLDISPTVGVYLDDVPYGSSTAFAGAAQLPLDVGLFDLDRIEVLRGPQGTLYGASTMGGLVKYVSKQPDATSFGVDAQAATSGTRDGGVSYSGAMAVNAPIVTDKLVMRASGFESRDGGYIANVALGQNDVNRSDVYGGRLDLLFTPAKALTVRIGSFLQNISRDGEGTADYASSGVPLNSTLDQYRKTAEPFAQHFRMVSGTITYDLGPAMLSSISGYQTARQDLSFDLSWLYVPLLAQLGLGSYSAVGAPGEITTNKFTQEVRLASRGTRALEWLVGGFYTHESSQSTQADSILDLAGQPVPNFLYTFSQPSSYEEYAAFGDLTWHLTGKFDVTGGIRYSHNDQLVEQIGSGLFGASRPPTSSGDHVFTYLANARYHFSDHATGYLRYATGYRPGGPNFVVIDATTGLPEGPATFEADRLKSYEAGVKAETTDRRLGLDLAGYYIDWSNIQISVYRGGFGFNGNAPGGATVRGGELTLTARPTAAFAAMGAFGYQDAHLSEADADLGGAKGERLPNVPRFTAAVNADYELPVRTLEPTLGATLRYVSDRTASFGSAPFNPQYRLPDYTVLDVRTGFVLDRVNVQVYVRNLFDERGQLSAIYTNIGPSRVAILQPRTFGLMASTRF